MAKSDNLRRAKKEQNDEFYTRLEDIVSEIVQHPDYVCHFEGKTVLCNCDDPEWSNFVEFFRKFFKKLKLKKMISTHYNQDGSPSYKLEWYGEKINGDTVNLIKTPLKGNGDFRSKECVELLKEADIIVTNPPFSQQLPVELIHLCFNNNKDFILIGDDNMVGYKNLFPLFKEGKIFIGYTRPKEFKQPDGTFSKFGNKVWYTSLEIDKIHEPLTLTKNYRGNEEKYPIYENFDAIDVKTLKDIPKDYMGYMGVPITFMSSYCIEQFEILGHAHGNAGVEIGLRPYDRALKPLNKGLRDGDLFYIENGIPKIPYSKIIIKRKIKGEMKNDSSNI